MGLFNFIKNLFAPSLDKKISDISYRITQLRKRTSMRPPQTKPIKESDFDIYTKSTNREINIFEPHGFSIETTMRTLRTKRIELEKQRIEGLRLQVKKNFESISNLIELKEATKATNLLIATYSAIEEIDDPKLLNKYASLLSEVNDLKDQLRLEEFECKRLERERFEKERKEKEKLEIIRKEELAKERLHKEQEAKAYEERLRAEEQAKELERKRLYEIVTCKKSNSDEFIRYLTIKGIKQFYHFTERSNLSSIKKYGGLYSWSYCEKNGIKIPYAGGDDFSRNLDIRKNLQDYVRLSFCSDHPMQYRLKQQGADLVLLKINIEVAGFLDTRFSDINATDSHVQHGSSLEDLQRVNLYAVTQKFVKKGDEIFSEHQAECMVKTFIPIEFIENINNPINIH